MALIKCPECGREGVSDKAINCPNCGYPINHYVNEVVVTEDDMSISNKENNKANIQNNIGSKKNNVPLILFFIISGVLLIRMISVLVVSSSEYNEINSYYTSTAIEIIESCGDSVGLAVLPNDMGNSYSEGGIPEFEKEVRNVSKPYIAINIRVGAYILFVIVFIATIIEIFGRKKWEITTFIDSHVLYLIIALVDVGTTIFIHLVIKNKSVLYGELARLTDLEGFSETSTATVIGTIIGIVFIVFFLAIYKITASNIDEIE